MTLSGGSVPTATIPSVNVSITDGNNKESELCFAGGTDVTVLSWQLLYYYDTSLRPYKDLFLTEPVTCTPSSTGGGGGTMPRQIPIDNELPIL